MRSSDWPHEIKKIMVLVSLNISEKMFLLGFKSDKKIKVMHIWATSGMPLKFHIINLEDNQIGQPPWNLQYAPYLVSNIIVSLRRDKYREYTSSWRIRVGGLGRKKKLFSRGYRTPSSALSDDFTAYPSWQLRNFPGLVTLAPDNPRNIVVNTSWISPCQFSIWMSGQGHWIRKTLDSQKWFKIPSSQKKTYL